MFSYLLPVALKYINEKRDIQRRNRERLKQSERNEAKYINDFNRDIVKWHNDNTNRDIEVDNKWQDVLGKIASDDLKLWAGISKGGLATQQAYAAMMSVGATEQTGARSGTTTNRREAVLKYAGRMNEISSQLSLARDNAALNKTTWGQEFTRFTQASQIKNIEGRPMPGTPPPSIPLENEPDLLTGLILPLAGKYIGYQADQDEYSSPYTDQEMRPNSLASSYTSGVSTSTGNVVDISNASSSEFDFGSVGGEFVNDYFRKRSKNQASDLLGSSFQLLAK